MSRLSDPAQSPWAEETYGIFLAHGNADKVPVRELYHALDIAGYSVFLDEREIDPADNWRPKLENALKTSRCFAVCVGPAGPGPWAEFEISFALRKNREDRTFPILPVLLPGGHMSQLEELSTFLGDFHCFDLTRGIAGASGLERLKQTIDRIRNGLYRGFHASRLLPPGDIQRGLARLGDHFRQSIKPYLAGNHLIPRSETEAILKFIEDGQGGLVLVHGSAGSGKSGVLYEIEQDCSSHGRSVLPVRLDRYTPSGSSSGFGATKLGLPGSPAECLASLEEAGEIPVFLIDQLDALRWTGAHSAEAWDVCREMIQETIEIAPKTMIVVCCRTFDLEHDPQLSAWVKETKNRKVMIDELDDQQVDAAIERLTAGRVPARGPDLKERQLLRHVLHLQMWLTLYPRLGEQGALATRSALMEAFWQDCRKRLTKLGVSQDRITELEAKLVFLLRDGALLIAPVSSLRLTTREREAFESLGILQFSPDGRRATFAHQSYLDYLVAVNLVDRIASDDGDVRAWLRVDQSLFRREQLRLVLAELRDRDPERYIDQVEEVLTAEDVRFHLKLLCLQFLAQVDDPTKAESDLVLRLLEESYWREHVIDEVIRWHPTWFEVLDGAGLLDDWLASGREDVRDTAFKLVTSVSEHCGDRVARLLRPYLDEPDLGPRLSWAIGWKVAEDSEDLFNFRLDLTKQGLHLGQYVDWEELAGKSPVRFLALVSYLLIALRKELDSENQRPRHQWERDWNGLEAVTAESFPTEVQQQAWKFLLLGLSAVGEVRRFASGDEWIFESYDVDFDALAPLVRLLRELAARGNTPCSAESL